MSIESFEFQKLKDGSTLPEIIRKSFRIPIEDSKSVWALINDKRYAVIDICVGGIGIILKNNSVFCVDQEFNDCELNLFNVRIKDLNGKVIHFSSSAGEKWQCGVQWIEMKENTVSQISEILSTMKEKLLKDDTILFEEE